MGSKLVDTTAIMQVIGCVFKSPELLNLDDKYTIIEDDFPDMFHKIVFGSIYNLYTSGSKQITIHNILDYLSSRPKNENIFLKQKGEEWLLKVVDNANLSSFDYYYNRMKKMTLLRAYESYGFNVSDIYDVDNILDIKKKELQENQLDNMTLLEIADKIDSKIEAIKNTYIGNDAAEEYEAGDGIFDLLDDLAKHPEVGLPLYGPLVNTVTRGARLKKFYLRSAPTGIGKAIPNDTWIPTSDGLRQVAHIKVGDFLFGEDGQPTQVMQIHPQPQKKEIWKITFSDGRIAKCCGEHLWEYRYETHRGFAYRVEDIQTIYNRTLNLKNGLKDSDNKGYRFHIKLNKAVNYPSKNYYLPPYTMGAFLGDGSFRYSSINKSFSFSSEDEQIPNLICSDLKQIMNDIYTTKTSMYNFNWSFRSKNNPNHPIWVEEFLKEYPELWNIKSEDKFIPREYLEGSIEQRKALLQGLLDTDGSVDASGRVSFTTISSKLRNDMIELCRSLGYIVKYSIDKRVNKYTTGECYILHIQAPKEEKLNFFRLERKQSIVQKYYYNNKREEYKDHLAIVNIEKTTELTEMTCFTVNNSSHLFLMNDYIVTHNTRTMIADACYIGCNKLYDPVFGWIRTGVAQPVLYITTEQELSEIQTMMLSFLSNVNEDHILNQTLYVGDEPERVKEAARILASSPIYVKVLPDFSLQDVENTIKQNIREHEVRYICYDYIHTSLKILEEITRRSGGVRLREDNILFMLSIKLKDLCNKYNVFILSATQLSSDYQDADTPDQNLLRGAKSIADKIDYGSILLPVKQNDLDKLKDVLSLNAFENPTIKISVYKNRRGKYKGIYLWCKADLGTCRVKPMFATGWDYGIINMVDMKIKVEEDGAFSIN